MLQVLALAAPEAGELCGAAGLQLDHQQWIAQVEVPDLVGADAVKQRPLARREQVIDRRRETALRARNLRLRTIRLAEVAAFRVWGQSVIGE